MKVTYNWLKDFVEIKIPALQLAEKLTMSGLEVTSLESKGGDWVFELEITSNRPDWLSVIGIAREVAAITGKKLKLDARCFILDTRKHKRASSIQHPVSKLEIKIENKKDCPLYTARVIKGLQVQSSPGWLKKRLELIGIRSVNNVVDITNYVLMETGQPLHVFDLDKIKQGLISVRRAAASEKITLIDGQQKALDKDILVIADKESPVAIAGIMGGMDSEVGAGTKNILLEAAVFDPILTRRASRKLGLSSESSYRFERGIDTKNADVASLRATSLILDLAGGGCVSAKSTTRGKIKTQSITLKTQEVNRVLGNNYKTSEIKRILSCLGFAVKQQKAGVFNIKVPSFRIDVSQPVDLIEEVARISGYDKVLSRIPRVIPQMDTSEDQRKENMIRDILLGLGENEVFTYSLISRRRANAFGYADLELMAVANPLTSEQEVLRPSLLPGLSACIGYNLNQHKQKDIQLFEIGKVFCDNREKLSLGIAHYGSESQQILPHIRGTLEILLHRVGITEYEFIGAQDHPCLSIALIVNKKKCARLGRIKPDILERLDIKNFIFAAELDLGILFAEIAKIEKKYKPIPLYPEAVRDISAILKLGVTFGEITKKIKAEQIPYLVGLELIDIYSGEQIPSGHQGLTLSCTYRCDERTLTGEEVDSTHQRVLDILKNEFSAQQR
ncbi:MAG: phenylalanine--tRNA ligase subunit beta [Candidatus Omnitrophica bacterium]|nr:phenylalanine--tRNA ligase subunit beta [Candidatus Omnitrophota bacterium]